MPAMLSVKGRLRTNGGDSLSKSYGRLVPQPSPSHSGNTNGTGARIRAAHWGLLVQYPGNSLKHLYDAKRLAEDIAIDVLFNVFLGPSSRDAL